MSARSLILENFRVFYHKAGHLNFASQTEIQLSKGR